MKNILNKILILSILIVGLASCEDDIVYNQDLLKNDFSVPNIFVAHPNPNTGIAYTSEELTLLDYDPKLEERYIKDQTVDIAFVSEVEPSKVNLYDVDGNLLETYTSFESYDGNKFISPKFVKTLEEIGLSSPGEKTSFKYETFIDNGNEELTALTIKFVVKFIEDFDPNADLSKDLVGYWRFNDPNNLLKASRGNDLVLGGAASHNAVAGVNAEDGAALLDIGTWYDVNHGMSATGGGANVNEFTMIWDAKVATGDLGKYICLLQDLPDNSADGSVYIHPNAGFWFKGGPGGHAEGTIQGDTWHRIVLAVKSPEVRFYVDGVEIYQSDDLASLDGRQSLDLSKFIILGENSSNAGNGEDNPIAISDFILFDVALGEARIKTLPTVDTPVL